MKKHFRPIIATLCVCALLFAVFILAVNLYVQSAAVQNRVRSTLSEAIGMPIGMFRATFSPWGGFRLDQIKVASDIPGSQLDFLKAECLEVRCEFIPLLKGQVVLRRIALDAPQVVFQKNALGQYRLPRHPVLPPVVVTTNPVILPEAIHTPVVRATPSATPSAAANAKSPVCDLDIRKILLRDGNFRFLAQDGREILRLETVRISLNAKSAPNTFAGVLEIKKAVVFNRWEIANLEATVTLDNQKLHIDKLGGDLAEGRIEGEANADLSAPGQPYSLWIRLSKGQLPKFFAKDSDFASELEGLVHARLEYAGFATKEEKNTGHAELKISRAKIAGLPLFRLLTELVRSEEFGNFTIKKTEIKADITGNQVQITPSYLQSDHLEVDFAGRMDAGQKLDLKAQLLMDEELFKKLPSEARENFVKIPETKKQALDFVIDGPLTAPHTNLVNRLISEKLQKKFKKILGNFGEEEEKPAVPEKK